MSKTFALIATAVLLAGCATQSNEPSTGDATSAEASKPEIKCRYVRTTTSRVGQRVCEEVSD